MDARFTFTLIPLLAAALFCSAPADAQPAGPAPTVDANPVERALAARYLPTVSLTAAWSILTEPWARGASLSVMAKLSWPLDRALPQHIAPTPHPLPKATFYELLDRLNVDSDDDRADGEVRP